MKFRRLLSTAVLSAGLTGLAAAQPPADPAKPAVPPVATPAVAPTPTPTQKKALEALAAGNVKECLAQLEKACQEDKNLPPAKVLLSDILFKTGNGQAARQVLEEAARDMPNHPDVFLLNGTYALNEGRTTDGMLSFSAGLKASDSDAFNSEQRKRFTKSCRLGLANCYQTRGDFSGAFEQFNKLLEMEPKNGQIRQQVAVIKFAAGKVDECIADLKQAFADDATVLPPELVLGQLWDGKQEKDNEKGQMPGWKTKAEDAMKDACKNHPADSRCPREYGKWLLNQNRVPDAEGQLAEAAKREANNQGTLALQGLAARYKKDYAAAEKIFDGLNRDYPDNPFYAWNLAIVLAESPDDKKHTRAVAVAEVMQRTNQKNPEANAVLGWCYFKANRLEEAERALGASIQTPQGQQAQVQPDTVYYMAKVLDAKNNIKPESQELLRSAVESKSPFVYRNEATALLGELDKKFPPAPKKDPKEPKKP